MEKHKQKLAEGKLNDKSILEFRGGNTHWYKYNALNIWDL